jgi:hypothetical protein
MDPTDLEQGSEMRVLYRGKFLINSATMNVSRNTIGLFVIQIEMSWCPYKDIGINRLWKVKLSLITNYSLRHEDVWGSGCIDPRFLDLGTSWRSVVSFTPRPLYLRGKSSRYPLDTRLDGPQSRYGRCGEEKILDHTGTRTPTPWSSSP